MCLCCTKEPKKSIFLTSKEIVGAATHSFTYARSLGFNLMHTIFINVSFLVPIEQNKEDLRSDFTLIISCTKSTCTTSNLFHLWNANISKTLSIILFHSCEYNTFDISRNSTFLVSFFLSACGEKKTKTRF